MSSAAIGLTAGAGPVLRLRRSTAHLRALVRRGLLQIKADPNSLFDVVLAPVIYTVLFVYVFGGAISSSRAEYVQYVMPGLMAMVAINVAMTAGVGVNSDFSTGMMDRFRTLPISRFSVLAAQVLVEAGRMAVTMAVLLGMGFALGLRVPGGALGLAGAAGLTMLFGMALLWVSVLLGLTLNSPQAVQGIGMVAVLPLQFGSSIFAPTGTMPGWLRAFTDVNPLSNLADACRALVNGEGAVAAPALTTVAWAAGIALVVAPLAAVRFGRGDR
ncbi:Daunorubicin/doxorubicin resistance ABC transporter permease protein DrrB [Streptomyces sp. RB5]|uniref:Transport permease protein n=1 Tax=Streptomyces smaragdinus TaxID=2585196 RepID=A0A7K0CCV2_9ACTN|nr:ABC transporter permease [Streptomyces smaragdinus]MQY11288.1 Daunorubicin/doxorubicin resistance ABC transporter permease protein DrrB [Streptomyces smaragdinus]